MPNICLTLAYDGTNFSGWQVQPDRRTVQTTIEQAIRRLTGEKVALYSAGRTDTGVHALGQVANFQTQSTIPPANWRPALQTCLPDDIVLLDSVEVPTEFHATFSAVRKRYRYVIANGPLLLPQLRTAVHHVRRPLDLDSMRTAARALVGRHDFRAFETDWPNKATSIRTVESIEFGRCGDWPVWTSRSLANDRSPCDLETGPFLWMEITADGFLYNMVRSIMGTLLNVGRGAWPPERVAEVLQGQSRTRAGNTAPACGLYLAAVDYTPFSTRSDGQTGL